MPSRRLSLSARRFLAQEVHSVMHLELVLLLARHPMRLWSAADAARELRVTEAWTRGQLSRMVGQGMARAAEAPGRYGWDVSGPWTAAITEIHAHYPGRRTSIIKHIFASPGSEAEGHTRVGVPPPGS